MDTRANVLLVDDDEHIRPIMCELLEDYGHRPLVAGDLATARELLSHEHVDCLLLDWNLAGEDSGELLDELASRDDAPPTVLFSASVGARAIAEIYELPLIGKPFNIDELDATLRRAMRQTNPSP